MAERQHPLDALNNVGGGLSILLESDAVMDALAAIPREPGADTTMADMLTATAASFADLSTAITKELEGE
jgi:hypothetical protein